MSQLECSLSIWRLWVRVLIIIFCYFQKEINYSPGRETSIPDSFEEKGNIKGMLPRGQNLIAPGAVLKRVFSQSG